MILSQTAIISAPAPRNFLSFDNLQTTHTRWRPDHITFRWLQDGRQAVGNRFCFEERIHDEHHKRTRRYNKVERDRLIEFVPDNLLTRVFLRLVRFLMQPLGDQCRFTQEVHVLAGPLGQRLNRAGFEAVDQHMREEGDNLKALMEAANMPGPT